MTDLIAELKRRRVFRALALYVVGALGVLQAAAVAQMTATLPLE